MTDEKTDEEVINQAIDEIITKTSSEEDIKKRRPTKPFRYLKNEEEIKSALTQEDMPPSVMKSEDSPKIVEDFMNIVGMGDVETIENIIQKHVTSRKFSEKP